jgi:hypothetical protein
MSFERGHPKGKLQELGKVHNRRGTTIRFKPDTEIFGAKAAFKPQRLFKMARSKAYLFGGVKIRWRCDPGLLRGLEDVPAEDEFHFPARAKGLSRRRNPRRHAGASGYSRRRDDAVGVRARAGIQGQTKDRANARPMVYQPKTRSPLLRSSVSARLCASCANRLRVPRCAQHY